VDRAYGARSVNWLMPRWTFRTPSRLLANAPTELKALLITVRREGDFGLRASR
jgi:hypothetical protein